MLDLESFEVTGSSHNMKTSLQGNIITFRFDNILLVDSTTNEPGSNGYVLFSISPIEEIELGSELNNTAHIYFDFNRNLHTLS